MISTFSTLTYNGSLYLQKKTRISLESNSGRFCSNKLIFRRETHWTSGGEDSSVTSGGAILRTSCLMRSSRLTCLMWIMITWDRRVNNVVGNIQSKATLTAASTTLPFTCWNWGTTRSHICSLSFSSCVSNRARAFKIATLPHSEHSLSAIKSLVRIVEVIVKYPGSEAEREGCWDEAEIWISERAATVLATTCQMGRNHGHSTNAWTYHGIAIRYHLLQLIQEPILQDQFRFQIVELGNAQRGCLPYIRILVP